VASARGKDAPNVYQWAKVVVDREQRENDFEPHPGSLRRNTTLPGGNSDGEITFLKISRNESGLKIE
jgi:hypothetical protein